MLITLTEEGRKVIKAYRENNNVFPFELEQETFEAEKIKHEEKYMLYDVRNHLGMEMIIPSEYVTLIS